MAQIFKSEYISAHLQRTYKYTDFQKFKISASGCTILIRCHGQLSHECTAAGHRHVCALGVCALHISV